MKLYHYTCAHSAERIRKAGELRPWHQVLLGGVKLVWFTDLEQPARAALGLTSHTLSCDRTEYRVTVETLMAERWVRYARRLPMEQRRPLELAPGVLPMHWWISLLPVPVMEVAAVKRGEHDSLILAHGGGRCPSCGATYPRTIPAGQDQRCWTCWLDDAGGCEVLP